MGYSFVFSASSFSTLIKPEHAFTLMKCVGSKSGLASSYDIQQYKLNGIGQYYEYIEEIDSFSENGKIYIDSGNYEASRFKDDWNRDQHLASISDLNKNFYYFTFDKYEHFTDFDNAKRELTRSIEDLLSAGVSVDNIIPIFHICRQMNVIDGHKFLKKIIRFTYDKYSTRYIALPERDLGDGLFNRLDFASTLRDDINTIDSKIKIHLLGTGNPLSMLLFHCMGVHSFDGLEWCRQSMDTRSALVFHPQQYDLFKDVFVSQEPKIIELLARNDFPYDLKMALHNACFMKNWDKLIQKDKKKCSNILKKSLTPAAFEKASEYIRI